MKLFSSFFRPVAAGWLLLCLLGAALPLSAAEPAGPAGQQTAGINFSDVDINVFIQHISELTGRKFIVDPAVKGKITVIFPESGALKKEDAWQIFESVLEVHGYATVPSGALTKIVPSAQARSKSIPTLQPGDHSRPDDRVVTRIIPIVNSSPSEVKKTISQLVSKTSVVIDHDQSGVLIITDALSNISRLLEIIKAVDVPSQGEELAIIPLRYASAAALSKSVGQLFVQSAAKAGRPPVPIKIIAYERTNSLIVFAPKAQIEKIRGLLEQLDREVTSEGGNIHVYYLQHANAEELVKVLTSLPGKTKSSEEADSKVAQPKAEGPQQPQAQKTEQTKTESHPVSAQLSADMKITADPETNALIVTASQDEYMALEEVIKQLDIPRRMVYLEALIMEVSIDKQFDIGAEWGGKGSFHDETGTLGGGFTDNAFKLISGISKGTAGMTSGATLGMLKKGVKIGGIYFPNIGAVLNAFQKDSDINIIATPQILTTDNKDATITVGENVPYITSKNSSSSGSSQDYTNYEYKDVGTTLKITPQINQANLLRLEISVEVTRLKSEAGVATPTTYKRSASTTVVVHNQEIVVIGGMIGQDTTSGDYKVPLLGDIPVAGWLFKSHEDSRRKTNMFIFISPRIVESSPQLADVYYKKRNVLEEVKAGSSEVPEQLLQTKLRQEDIFALLDKGTAKFQDKEYAEAKAYFEQVLENAPENPYALLNLAAVYAQEGDREKAAAACRQVLAQDGQGTDAALLKAAQERLRQLEAAPGQAADKQEPQGGSEQGKKGVPEERRQVPQ